MVAVEPARCHGHARCSMSRFAPTTCYLRRRLTRTTYEDIDEFKQLLVLERLIGLPFRGEFEEALFLSLRDRFPNETEVLILEIQLGLIPPHTTTEVPSRSNSELLRHREQRRLERRDWYRRERADWLTSGGLK